jgi:ribosome-associated translation inhibitor RaiA
MQIPLEFHTRDLDPELAAEIRELVEEQVVKLERVAPDLVSCRVHVEKDVHDMRSGNRFRVTIRATIPPKKELIGHREPVDRRPDETIEAIVRLAFGAVRRQVLEQRHRRGVGHANPEWEVTWGNWPISAGRDA